MSLPISGITEHLTCIHKETSFLASEFLTTLATLAGVYLLQGHAWLMTLTTCSYLASRTFAKRAYGLGHRGFLTTEFVVSAITAACLFKLYPPAEALTSTVIVGVFFNIARGAAKARPESNTIIRSI